MRSPRAALAVLAALVSLAAGCGGGRPAPRVWAAAVCKALSPWRAQIGDLTSSTQQQMTARTTPAQAKENLVRLLGGAEAASETARASVAGAGVPDVDGGDRVAGGFVTSLSAVRDAYGKARRTIEGLDTGPAFYDGVGAAVSTLNQEYSASALDTSTLSSPELREAFDEVPECR
jgi:hypothetical protein